MTASMRRLAEEFGLSRDTVARRIRDAGIKPHGEDGGYPVYRLRDVASVLVDGAAVDPEGNTDPDRLPPEKRRAWFQSEHERMNLEAKAGKLVPALEHERDVARVLGAVVQTFETLPDILERDEALEPHQVQRLQEILDARRLELFEGLTAEDEDARLCA